ncbi:hypothetical protein BJF78_23205 [Pseudonocardia sp. CNS-139]|nr:hypothetical protein BJF78_23205 [Pseudonocardia sp. CNS-139]
MPDGRAVELGWTRNFGGSRASTAAPGRPIVAELPIDLDAVATEGPDLVSATAQVGAEIAQTFGAPELSQFTTDGEIQFPYWDNNTGWRPSLTEWAKVHGVTIS